MNLVRGAGQVSVHDIIHIFEMQRFAIRLSE